MHESQRRRFAVFVAVLVVVLTATLASARTIDHVRGENAARKILRAAEKGESVILSGLPLGRPALDSVELIPTEVWGPQSTILVHGPGGSVTEAPVPTTRYFRGYLPDDPEAFVIVSVDGGDITGAIVTSEKRFAISLGRPRKGGKMLPTEDAPLFLAEIDEANEAVQPESRWVCDIDKKKVVVEAALPAEAAVRLRQASNAGSPAGATYSLTIAIDTDLELYTGLGSSTSAVTAYIGQLILGASTIYQRDIQTSLAAGTVNVRTVTGPYTATTTLTLLAQLSAAWHTNFPTASFKRSATILVSGKGLNGGIAFTDILCAQDFSCGSTGANCGSSAFANGFGGSYGVVASLSSGVTTTVPNPNATVNGTLYAIPNSSNFWMLTAFAHELGHIVVAEHTSCYPLTAQEKLNYGVNHNFIDHCLSGESGCYVGVTSAPTTELGTIMSYCHNVTSGGFRQSRYTFGQTGKPSEKMLPILKGAVDSTTPAGTITMASNLACSAGQTASVASCNGCTYGWQIIGGTITGPTNTNSITFTPSAPSVTVTATISNSLNCTIIVPKTSTTACPALAAPTGVIAGATSPTSVLISWNVVSGAATYQVHRSTNNSTYAQVGSPTAATVFSDTTALADTSYSYQVRAVDASANTGPFSGKDFATTVIFADPGLSAGSTSIMGLHLTQLRTAVNALRVLGGLGGASFTDPAISSSILVKRIHVVELRSALDAARAALSAGALSYTDATITAGITTPKAAHFSELRSGVQ